MIVLAQPLVHRRELERDARRIAAEVARLLHEHRAHLERAALREIAAEREAGPGIARAAADRDVVERLRREDATRYQQCVRARDDRIVLRPDVRLVLRLERTRCEQTGERHVAAPQSRPPRATRVSRCYGATR